MDKLNENRLRQLLGEGLTNPVKLVFVSACHSEMIGQLFKRVGVPIVVAVNSHTAILDDVCRLFAKHFYQHLITGNTPRIAFKEAKRAVKAGNIDCFSCCCAHLHKSWCKWKTFSRTPECLKEKDCAHNAHMPNST